MWRIKDCAKCAGRIGERVVARSGVEEGMAWLLVKIMCPGPGNTTDSMGAETLSSGFRR